MGQGRKGGLGYSSEVCMGRWARLWSHWFGEKEKTYFFVGGGGGRGTDKTKSMRQSRVERVRMLGQQHLGLLVWILKGKPPGNHQEIVRKSGAKRCSKVLPVFTEAGLLRVPGWTCFRQMSLSIPASEPITMGAVIPAKGTGPNRKGGCGELYNRTKP